MNIQADKLLWKNKLRLMKGVFRHTWQGAVGLMMVADLVLYQFFSAAGETDSVRLFRCRMWLSAVTAMFLSGMFSWFLCGLQFNDDFALTSMLLLFYICCCSFLSWIFYHGKTSLRAAVAVLFAACTAMLLSKSWISAGILAVVLCALVFYAHRFLKLDLLKYNRRLQFLDASLATVSQNDFVKMSRMAEENRPSVVNGPKFQRFRASKKSALWIKSLLEIFRMQKQILVLFALLILGGWIISRTELLAWLPFLDDPAAARVLAAYCTAAGFTSLFLFVSLKTLTKRNGVSIIYVI